MVQVTPLDLDSLVNQVRYLCDLEAVQYFMVNQHPINPLGLVSLAINEQQVPFQYVNQFLRAEFKRWLVEKRAYWVQFAREAQDHLIPGAGTPLKDLNINGRSFSPRNAMDINRELSATDLLYLCFMFDAENTGYIVARTTGITKQGRWLGTILGKELVRSRHFDLTDQMSIFFQPHLGIDFVIRSEVLDFDLTTCYSIVKSDDDPLKTEYLSAAFRDVATDDVNGYRAALNGIIHAHAASTGALLFLAMDKDLNDDFFSKQGLRGNVTMVLNAFRQMIGRVLSPQNGVVGHLPYAVENRDLTAVMLAINPFMCIQEPKMQLQLNMAPDLGIIALDMARGKIGWDDFSAYLDQTSKRLMSELEAVRQILADPSKDSYEKIRDIYSGPPLARYRTGVVF